MGSERKSEKSSCPCRCTDIPTQWKSEERATITSASSCSSPKSRTAEGSMPCLVSWRRSLSAMFATIWMCTQEWSLISIRTTAFTFATCHQPFSCLSSFTRSSSFRSFRLPRTGRLMCIFSTACAGVSRVSRTASSEIGSSIRSCISRSRSLTPWPPFAPARQSQAPRKADAARAAPAGGPYHRTVTGLRTASSAPGT